MTKYHAIPTVIDGIRFLSKREASRYQELKLLERGRLITELQLQPAFPITINGMKVCTVKLDFVYIDKITGKRIFEDSKGMDNPMSRLKRKLVQAMYGIEVLLT